MKFKWSWRIVAVSMLIGLLPVIAGENDQLPTGVIGDFGRPAPDEMIGDSDKSVKTEAPITRIEKPSASEVDSETKPLRDPSDPAQSGRVGPSGPVRALPPQ